MKDQLRTMTATLLLSVGLFTFISVSLSAAIYYVDPAGNDTATGTTPSAPWKSLAWVNRQTFAPGDEIRFKAGGVWAGQLNPRGSGHRDRAITLTRYGDGADPLINGGGLTDGAIKLLNQEGWEIRHFEVTNHGPEQGQWVGVKVQNSTGAVLHHIVIADCAVHDVNGYASGFYGANAGIAVVADLNNSTWNDVLIENNEVHDVDRLGIFVGPTKQVGGSPEWMHEPKSEHIKIQNNTVYNLGGDGIINFITRDVLVQNNLVYETGLRCLSEARGPKNPTGYVGGASAAVWNVISDNTIMQFNEVYRCMAGLDGEAFDVDMGTNHTVVQFNYSHDNLGGFVLLCESGSPLVDINDAKVRFNISQSDGQTKGILHVGQYGFPPGPDKTHINNNTIYVPATVTDGVKMWRPYGMKTIVGDAFIYNNIFYVLGKVTYPGFTGAKFDSNIFYGDHPEGEPDDPKKITGDPKLVAPGSATFGLASVEGYKLQAGSPALGSGKYTGKEFIGGTDYWGNVILPSAPLNRGAYTGVGVTGVVPNWAFNAKVTASNQREARGWSPQRLVDGQRTSFLDSQGFAVTAGSSQEPEAWMALELGAPRSIRKIVLYPTTVKGKEGEGFPREFELQAWEQNRWVTCLKETDLVNPGKLPQTFSLEHEVTASRVRLLCRRLPQVDGMKAVQLAELELNP